MTLYDLPRIDRVTVKAELLLENVNDRGKSPTSLHGSLVLGSLSLQPRTSASDPSAQISGTDAVIFTPFELPVCSADGHALRQQLQDFPISYAWLKLRNWATVVACTTFAGKIVLSIVPS